MPIQTGAGFTGKKNDQENLPIFLYRIHEWNGSDDLLFAAYDADVVFDGDTYVKYPISHESVSDNSAGEIDQVSVRVSNVSRDIQAYLEAYDLRGKKVTIIQVFADALSDPDDAINFIYYIDTYSADEKNVEFMLTTKFDVLDVQLPVGQYLRNHCRWKFKSTECGYAGAESVCNKTKQDCRDNKDNVLRFGGFPSIPQRRLFT